LLTDEIASRSTADAVAAFASHDVPAGRVLGRDEVAGHPQAVARDSVRTVDAPHIGAVQVPRPAWRFGTTPPLFPTDAPELGRDTRAILTDLGYDEAAIDRLVALDVIKTDAAAGSG
ncbi:MAG: CoA transferase, partial [Actinomycetota bacterium]|nr:CoA transferase [Actinomycetota bacterium]